MIGLSALGRAALDVMPLAVCAALTGSSYWEMRYRDGRVIDERAMDWIELPRRGRAELRLICPNGRMGVLGSYGVDNTDRFVQFKGAVAQVRGVRGGLIAAMVGSPQPRHTTGHVIGLLSDTNRGMLCWRWDYETGELVGPYEVTAQDTAGAVNALPGAPIRIEYDRLGARAD